ncbi:hypothetical protein M422DRAFT_167356 [Sphaerobolus stellatus SS14]|uniref:rRNA methyltransferase 2, mitochondrial n=1 Tax=Sphaerobolus stellatus (strain SS14) TaxID=990650 RepID=A0A0C9VRW2_SPHS4|nr:hypothetical protein M422DRAFT_167356 [Sphaerobolus stellatus SS14]
MHPSPRLLKLSSSSKQWLTRHSRDPYVKQRVKEGFTFRSRSAIKLLEIDREFQIFGTENYHPRVVVDLGAAPGGWSQVTALRLIEESLKKKSIPEKPIERSFGLKRIVDEELWSDHLTNQEDSTSIIALDLKRIDHIEGVQTIQADFLSPLATERLGRVLPRTTLVLPRTTSVLPQTTLDSPSVDLILSDMAANATGNTTADIANSLRLSEAVFEFAQRHLRKGGNLVMKYFEHPDTREFQKTHLNTRFKHIHRFKPKSSRSESAEVYWVCTGWHEPDVNPRRRLRSLASWFAGKDDGHM